jgi:hypothetical protein
MANCKSEQKRDLSRTSDRKILGHFYKLKMMQFDLNLKEEDSYRR